MNSDISKDRKVWKRAFAVAAERLAGLGGMLDWSPHAYEAFRWVHPAVTLILYPHRTSAGNYHIRVRKGACTDRGVLRTAIVALAENSCQFYFPTERAFHDEGVRLAVEQKRGFTS